MARAEGRRLLRSALAASRMQERTTRRHWAAAFTAWVRCVRWAQPSAPPVPPPSTRSSLHLLLGL